MRFVKCELKSPMGSEIWINVDTITSMKTVGISTSTVQLEVRTQGAGGPHVIVVQSGVTGGSGEFFTATGVSFDDLQNSYYLDDA